MEVTDVLGGSGRCNQRTRPPEPQRLSLEQEADEWDPIFRGCLGAGERQPGRHPQLEPRSEGEWGTERKGRSRCGDGRGAHPRPLTSVGPLPACPLRGHRCRSLAPLSCRKHRSYCTTDPRWTCCEPQHSKDSAARGPREDEDAARRGRQRVGCCPGRRLDWIPSRDYVSLPYESRTRRDAPAQGCRRDAPRGRSRLCSGSPTSGRVRRRPSSRPVTFACFPGLENLGHFRSVYELGFTISPQNTCTFIESFLSY